MLPRPGIVFIGMETSGVLRRRFQAAGFETYSCDLLPSEDGGEEPVDTDEGVSLGRHLVGDVFQCLDNMAATDLWPDLAIFHPECPMHTVASAWAFKDPDFDRYPGVGYHQRVKPDTLVGAARREERVRQEALVERIAALPIKRKAMENPRGTIPTRTSLGPPQQVLQPYEHGEDASKQTCLWLWNLPPVPIDPRRRVQGRMVFDKNLGRIVERWGNQTDTGQNRLSPGDDRWKERSRTYDGIGDSMVAGWQHLIGT